MRHTLICLFVLTISISCLSKQLDRIDYSKITNTAKDDQVETNDWSTLKAYIGTYPKDTDFFKNGIVVNELQRILGKDYQAYLDHVSLSGCGAMVVENDLIIGDISQLHVGGYSSVLLIDGQHKKMYLFWLKGTVKKKIYKIYGDRPIPQNVLDQLILKMNETWGHVALFEIHADSILINLNKNAR